MAQVGNILGQAIQLEADPAGYFKNQQQQQQLQAQQKAIAPLFQNYGLTPEQAGALHPDVAANLLHTLQQGSFQKTQQAQQKSFQDAEIANMQASREIGRGQLGLQGREVKVKEGEAARKTAEAQAQRDSVQAQTEAYSPVIDALPSNEKIRAQAIIAGARKSGDMKPLETFLSSSAVKPGTDSHLLYSIAQNPNILKGGPAAVETYFFTHLKDKGAAAKAADSFNQAYTNNPMQIPLFRPNPELKLNPAGASSASQYAPQAPQAPSMITVKAPSGATQQVADTPQNRELAKKPGYSLVK